MFGRLTKLSFFILSYTPLYIMLIIIYFKEYANFLSSIKVELKSPFHSILNASPQGFFFFGLSLLIILSIIALLKFLLLKGYKESEVSTYSNVGDTIMSYIVTYIVPLTSIDIQKGNVLLANFFLFLIIAVIYTSNNLIYLNPIFILLKYHVLLDEKTQKIVISKYDIWELRELKEDDKRILVYRMDDSGLLLIKKQKKI